VNALKDAGAKNTAAVRALLKDLEKAEIGEDGAVKGLAEQIKALKESDAYLFTSSEAGKPTGATPAASGTQTPNGTVTKEQFAKMGYKQREELYNTNKELYESLAK
jgi:hypothetical protein